MQYRILSKLLEAMKGNAQSPADLKDTTLAEVWLGQGGKVYLYQLYFLAENHTVHNSLTVLADITVERGLSPFRSRCCECS